MTRQEMPWPWLALLVALSVLLAVLGGLCADVVGLLLAGGG